uniref:DDT domain-containing protein n=1 Tax=Davidia involucrata TaxID=16924 RepID=A0A5B6YSH3_DAVIN
MVVQMKQARWKQQCRKNHDCSPVEKAILKKRKKKKLNDALLRPDYILKKVFRKDGPPLAVEFDSLPSQAFLYCNKAQPDSKNSHRACQENQRALKGKKVSRNSPHACLENQKAPKRRKVSKPIILDYQACNKSVPVKKHGIGKGLMTVWRATNPDAGDFPTGVDFPEREATAVFRMSTSIPEKPLVKEKRSRQRRPVMRRLGNKLQDKRRPSTRSKKVACNKIEEQKQPPKEKCELATEGVRCQEDLDKFAMLADDEELELRELQAGPNPLTCCAHFATNGLHGCSLCKDLLAKFPPNSVTMKQPLHMQPWDSSPELVKKLFKVFHFLYTYAVRIRICSFTLDEFAQAFHDKDPLLLGKVHAALLKLLLSDVEMELSNGFFPYASKNGKFLELLHSVEHQEFVVRFWKKSLNPLTWTEILRQVLVAAGFGSKNGTLRRETLNLEINRMVKYGLSPGTLKGELFRILLEKGNNGLKVSELAKSSQIVELNLDTATDELELLISSMLSSDITLFEKISSSAYRLRISSVTEEAENFQSDSEDFGSIADDSRDSGQYSSSDDSENDMGTTSLSKLKQRNRNRSRNNMMTVYTEIDESHPGEVWLLGLMEGEYSDLRIEEQLNALVALVDLVSAGSSIRTEDPVTSIAECVPNINHCGSGAKIKRSSAKQHNLPKPFGGHIGQAIGIKQVNTTSVLLPVDSLASISKVYVKEKSSIERKDAKQMEVEDDLHPMQSIFLGSDRRYNRYWLFLGPCNEYDRGHKRIYFESSEDGHWEVIDTEEGLCTLLSALDCRGTREAFLLASLEEREAYLCRAMSSTSNAAGIRQLTQSDQSDLIMSREDSSSPVSDVDNNLCLTEIRKDFPASSAALVLETGKKAEQEKQKWSRVQAFDTWIWNSFYSDLNAVKYSKRSYLDSLTRCECCHDLYWRDEKHCKTCHTTFELDFDLEERYTIHAATCRENGDTDMFPKHKVLSSQLQSLKAAIYAIESVMPEDALVGAWTKSAHKLWVKRLRRTSTLAEFLQVLADFVGAINEHWLSGCSVAMGSNSILEEIISCFPTMPQTSSAVALWLVKLDALIAPHLEKFNSEKKQEMHTKLKGKRANQ